MRSTPTVSIIRNDEASVEAARHSAEAAGHGIIMINLDNTHPDELADLLNEADGFLEGFDEEGFESSVIISALTPESEEKIAPVLEWALTN